MNATRLMAAVGASAAVHAGIALVGWSPDPRAADLGSEPAASASAPARAAPIRIRVATAQARSSPVDRPSRAETFASAVAVASSSPAAVADTEPPHGGRAAAVPLPATTVADPVGGIAADHESDAAPSQSDEVASPTPVSYPVFVLPPNDDPHRIGLTRLLLVVSSGGDTMDVIVTASTMSQDYVDRVVDAFRAMRFKPARMRGLPYPGYYEVVVNFEYDPPGNRAAL